MSGRARRVTAAAAVVLATAAVLGVVLLQSSSASHSPPGTGVPPGETTTSVTRRTLTESSTVDGTLGYGATFELYDRIAGTFTWLPSVGAVVHRGGTLFRVNDLPVVLMYGLLPAYRALREGVGDGPDVSELNENLIDLGYDPYGAITDVERFSDATATAVRRWQKAEGLPQTGRVELGRIDFAPGARRITTVHVSLGQDPPAGSKEPSTKKPSAKKSPAKKPSTDPPKDSPEQPSASHEGEEGASAGTLVLTTTSTQQVVQLKLKAEQQQLARLGETAPVMLPGGEVVRGRVIEVGTVASESSKENEKPSGGGGGNSGSEGGESSTIPVTLALRRHVVRLDQAPVSVELVKSVRHEVLTVPATALIATAGGGYAIETLEGSRRVQVAVTPGMFADGYVQIEGEGVHEGQTVIESQ
jgi:peptidoglycan hydrolase-like protein with peptidoglycan-binding domain